MHTQVSDFYQVTDVLDNKGLNTLLRVRHFMENIVQPGINYCWTHDEFPYGILSGMHNLDIVDKDPLLTGLITAEMGRIDPSIATFYTIQNGLVIGTIEALGTPQQKKKWLPSLKSFEKIGCFAMTEPDVGSAAFDMKTSAQKVGNDWILQGEKKWIGNSTWCDISIIWARDLDDNKIKGFIIENKSVNLNSLKVVKIENKFGLRICQNGLMHLNHVVVPDENVLQGSFKDILRQTRYLVGWEAVGLQMGAFEHTLRYSKERKQFGKPIASFQLIQDLLAKMLANVTACQCMMFRLAQLNCKGVMTDAQAALAKAFTTSKARETVSYGREIFGANGMSIDYNIGRFFCDVEALYSYEGSYQMQNLIIGKHITGLSAFT